jgi:hypothetical protein
MKPDPTKKLSEDDARLLRDLMYTLTPDSEKPKFTTTGHPIDHDRQRKLAREQVEKRLDEHGIAQAAEYVAHPQFRHVSRRDLVGQPSLCFYKHDEGSPTGCLSMGWLPETPAVVAFLASRGVQVCGGAMMGAGR